MWYLPETELLVEFLAKILAAVCVGFLIGLERERSHKPAGIRTNILVVLGATLFTTMSFSIGAEYEGDFGRIAANIVTGIGFLGAGAIIQAQGSVKGLTTAAIIWVNGALGMMIGAGKLLESALATVVVIIILYGLRRLEKRLVPEDHNGPGQ